jgi:predicted ABC-type ATPase
VTNPRLVFLAGPNGAGKTTFFETYLKSSGLDFVNADRIAASLEIPSGEAAAAADAIRAEFLREGRSFITETVFSDPAGAKLTFLREAVTRKYHVLLCYIGISTPELSEARVIQRVGEGGHDVPSDRLERRFKQSLKNLSEALAFVPEVQVFDNSSATTPFRLLLVAKEGRVEFRTDPVPAWLVSALPPKFGL